MNNTNGAEVLIAGGGLGGLATALALSRRGIPSRVLEQSSEFREIGAGIHLAPNVFRACDRLGVMEQMKEKAVFVDHLSMMDGLTGQEITRVRVKDACQKRYGYPYAIHHRADMLDVLVEASRASEHIALETSRRVVRVRDDGEQVTVETEDGSEYRGHALIGADGLWSVVRACLFGEEMPRVSGHVAYRAVLSMDQVPEELKQNAALLWAAPRNHLIHYPIRDWELFNVVAVFHSDTYVEGWNEPGDRDELMRHFADIGPLPMSLIEKVADWRMWVLCDREPTDVWSRGRITLIGDAAHPMLQYFAQGAAMAIEDGLCVADKIAESGDDPERAFRAYQKDRYLRTGRVQLMARFLGDVYHADGVQRDLRNQLLGARTQEKALEGLDWLYGGP